MGNRATTTPPNVMLCRDGYWYEATAAGGIFHDKYDPAHPGVREGSIFIGHEPFPFLFGALVPKRIDGLLVPVACSCSHVTYNAVRMEPVLMVLGEAYGIAAHLAIGGTERRHCVL